MTPVAPPSSTAREPVEASPVEVLWLPLGAGSPVVAASGRVYERASATVHRRRAVPLFHSALRVRHDGSPYVVEMAPVWSLPDRERGVVCTGPVGAAPLGRLRLFRYEVRCWPHGRIPDVAHLVGAPTPVPTDPGRTAALLAAVRAVPVLTWGRDELGAGDMWNSNSLVSWALAASDHDADLLPPNGGRAPGWLAGVVLAERADHALASSEAAA